MGHHCQCRRSGKFVSKSRWSGERLLALDVNTPSPVPFSGRTANFVRYRVVDYVGAGAMGEVENTELRGAVAKRLVGPSPVSRGESHMWRTAPVPLQSRQRSEQQTGDQQIVGSCLRAPKKGAHARASARPSPSIQAEPRIPQRGHRRQLVGLLSPLGPAEPSHQGGPQPLVPSMVAAPSPFPRPHSRPNCARIMVTQRM